jgi:hypothetical protein
MDPKMNRMAMTMQKVAITKQTGIFYEAMLGYMEKMHEHYKNMKDDGSLGDQWNTPDKKFKQFEGT